MLRRSLAIEGELTLNDCGVILGCQHGRIWNHHLSDRERETRSKSSPQSRCHFMKGCSDIQRFKDTAVLLALLGLLLSQCVCCCCQDPDEQQTEYHLLLE